MSAIVDFEVARTSPSRSITKVVKVYPFKDRVLGTCESNGPSGEDNPLQFTLSSERRFVGSLAGQLFDKKKKRKKKNK